MSSLHELSTWQLSAHRDLFAASLINRYASLSFIGHHQISDLLFTIDELSTNERGGSQSLLFLMVSHYIIKRP